MSAADLKRPTSTEADGQPMKRQRQDIQPSLKRDRSRSPSEDRILKRPPVIPLQPSQRLDLFRKKQKWRRSTLYAAKNPLPYRSQNKAITAVASKSSARYGEMAVQTDYVPNLESKTTSTKEKARKEAEKKVAGVFSGQLLYDTDDLEDQDKSPVKFPAKKVNGDHISDGNLSALLGPKKLVQSAKLEAPEPVKPAVIETAVNVGPSAGFTFMERAKIEEIPDSEPAPKKFTLGSTNIKETSRPSFGFSKVEAKKNINPPAFNFVDKKSEPSQSQEAKNAPEKPLLFGSKSEESAPPLFSKSDEKPADKPAFSLGSKIQDQSTVKPSFSFGSNPNNKPAANSEFSFGSKTDDKPAAFSFAPKTENKSVDKPTFSFGSNTEEAPAKTAFTFGSKPAEETTQAAKPAFNFASSSSADKPSLFGSKSDEKPPIIGAEAGSTFTPQALGSKSTVSSTGINFGSKPEEKTEAFKPLFGSTDKPAEAPKPFSFGAASTSSEQKPSAFGATIDDKPSVFSIGATTEKKDEKPSGLFGANASTGLFESSTEKKETTPTFGLGSVTEKKETTPSFSFGVATEKKDESKPLFGTANGTTDKPGFGFGTNGPSSSATEGPATKRPLFGAASSDKPVFNFGAATSTPAAAAAGATAGTVVNKPFSFGAATSTPAADPKPTLSGFGSTAKPAEVKSTGFGFGGSTLPNPASVFGTTNGTSTPSGFGFGQTSTPNPASAFGQAPTTSAFNFGASSTPAPATSGFNFAAPNPPKFNAGQVSINFAGSSTADPASVFGGVSSMPTAFGTPNAGAAPAFGTPVPTPSGGATGGARPQRRIAQMRSRRR